MWNGFGKKGGRRVNNAVKDIREDLMKVYQMNFETVQFLKRGIMKLIDDEGTPYLLKEKPYYLSANEYEVALNISQQLRKEGILTPPVLKGTKGYTLYHHQKYYSVQQYIESNNNVIDHVEKLGEVAAMLSQKSDRIDMAKGADKPSCRSLHFLDIDANSMAKSFQVMKQYVAGDQMKWIDQAEARFFRYEINLKSLPMSWVHGDLHVYNTVFTKQGMYLIDFDDIHWNVRIVDLVWPCIIHGVWDWPQVNQQPMLKEEMDIQGVKRLLQHYEKKEHLTFYEKKYLPAVFYALFIKSFICIEGLIRNSKQQSNHVIVQKIKNMLLLAEHLDFGVIGDVE